VDSLVLPVRVKQNRCEARGYQAHKKELLIIEVVNMSGDGNL